MQQKLPRNFPAVILGNPQRDPRNSHSLLEFSGTLLPAVVSATRLFHHSAAHRMLIHLVQAIASLTGSPAALHWGFHLATVSRQSPAPLVTAASGSVLQHELATATHACIGPVGIFSVG